MMINIDTYSRNYGLHVVKFKDLDAVLAEADEIAVAVNGVEAKVPVSEFIRLWHRHRPYLPSDQYRPTPMVERITDAEAQAIVANAKAEGRHLASFTI